MIPLARQIESCMSGLGSAGNGKLTARFTFTPDFLGFAGHFPGNPVLPGVCKIQAALAMLRRWYQREVILKEIVLAKFYAPVSSDAELAFTCDALDGESSPSLVRATVTSDDSRIAELRLRVAFAHRGAGES